MKGLILSGGKGTRMRPLTYTRAKQLMPIGNKPNIDYAVEDLTHAGVRDIVVIISPETGPDVRSHLGDGERFGARFQFIEQPAPLGLAHAVKTGQPALGEGEPFIMYLGDNLLTGGIRHLVESYATGLHEACILLTEVPNPECFGVAVRDESGHVVRLVEKPKEPISSWALVGVYLFSPKIFEIIDKLKPSARGEYEITDAIQGLIEGGFSVHADTVRGWWKDTGKPEDLLDANRLVLSRICRRILGTVETSELIGEVELLEGAVVRNSRVRGPVSIARNALVENAYVGPYTSIGPECVVRGVELEYSIMIQGSRVENLNKRIDSSLLGQGTVVLGRARRSQAYQFMLGDMSSVIVEGDS